MPPKRNSSKGEEEIKKKKPVSSSSSDSSSEEEKKTVKRKKVALTSSSESEKEEKAAKAKKLKLSEEEGEEGVPSKSILKDKSGKKIYWFWADDVKGSQDIWKRYSEEMSIKLEKGHQDKFNSLAAKKSKKEFHVAVDKTRYVDLTDEPYLQRRYDDPTKRRLVKRTVGEDLHEKSTSLPSSSTQKTTVVVSDSSSESSDSDSDSDDELVQWYWAGDSGGGPAKGGGHQDIWVEYDRKMSKKLENAYKQLRKKVKVDDERFVDLRNMLQRRHDDHMKRRSVKRGEPVKKKTGKSSSSTNNKKKKVKKAKHTSSAEEEERELASSDEERTSTQTKKTSAPSVGVSLSAYMKAPPTWTQQTSMDYYEEDVPVTSLEFQQISTIFVNSIAQCHRTAPNHKISFRSFQAVKLVRVQNPFLWMRYRSRKDKIKEDTRVMNPVPGVATGAATDPTVNEFLLFHGLNSNTIPGITRFGFDPRFCSLQGMFGAGLYFAENSSKSNQYCHSGNCTLSGPNATSLCRCLKTDEVKMLVCRVTLGDCLIEKVYRGNMTAKDYWYGRRTEPPKPAGGIYNSVLGESIAKGGTTLQLREYIVYESSQVYPEYILTFKRL